MIPVDFYQKNHDSFCFAIVDFSQAEDIFPPPGEGLMVEHGTQQGMVALRLCWLESFHEILIGYTLGFSNMASWNMPFSRGNTSSIQAHFPLPC